MRRGLAQAAEQAKRAALRLSFRLANLGFRLIEGCRIGHSWNLRRLRKTFRLIDLIESRGVATMIAARLISTWWIETFTNHSRSDRTDASTMQRKETLLPMAA